MVAGHEDDDLGRVLPPLPSRAAAVAFSSDDDADAFLRVQMSTSSATAMTPITKVRPRKMYGVGVLHELGGASPAPAISFTETPDTPLSGLILLCVAAQRRNLC